MSSQPRSLMNVQLIHDLLAMLFDRFDADTKLVRDSLVRKSFGNELEHLGLTRRQVGGLFENELPGPSHAVSLPENGPGNVGAKEKIPAADFPNGLEQFIL